jgi:hypothetical protein
MFKQVRHAGKLLTALGVAVALGGQTPLQGQEIVQTSVSLSGNQSTLVVELADGGSREFSLTRGTLYIDGAEAGTFTAGGALERAWREFLRNSSGDFQGAWAELTEFEAAEVEAGALATILETLEPLVTAAAASEVTASTPAPPEAPAQVEAPAAPGEIVEGGLVVQLSELEGLSRSLGRIGLAPGLSRVLNGDLKPPLRIVVEADRYYLPEGTHLEESLILVETDGVIAGSVAGNVLIAEGSLLIEPTAHIAGNVVSIESDVQNLGGIIGGAIREVDDFAPVIISPRPRVVVEVPSTSVARHIANGMGSLLRTVAMYMLLCFLGFLVVYFFRGHLETVSDTVSYSFGRAFLTGLFAEILVAPIFVVLLVLVLTWIAIPFYVLGVALAAILGYLAVAHAAGENLTRRRYPSWATRLRRANSYYYVLNGLGVLLALFAAASVAEMAHPILGWAYGLLIAAAVILSWVAGTAGFGAVLLSRAGTQRKFARPREVPALSVDSFSSLRPSGRRTGASRPRSTDLENDHEI